jgi:hypothetical protein
MKMRATERLYDLWNLLASFYKIVSVLMLDIASFYAFPGKRFPDN